MARFTCSFISYSLARTIEMTVIVPSMTCPESCMPDASHTLPKGKYHILYLLHGGWTDSNAWTSYTNIEFFAEEANIAVAIFSGENKAFKNQPSKGIDKNLFGDFLTKELPEFLGTYFPISTKREDSYLAGLSMGGYGALYNGLNHPELYKAIGGFSAGIQLPGTALEPDDPEMAARRIAEEKKEFPKVFLSCGTEDPLYTQDAAFRDMLKGLGADVTWQEAEGKAHEWRFWNDTVEQFIRWLPRTDAYAGELRKI